MECIYKILLSEKNKKYKVNKPCKSKYITITKTEVN